MAALVITTGQVFPTAVTGYANVTVVGTAGTALVAGKAVYVDASNKVQLADANAGSTGAAAVGIVLVNAQASQPVLYQKAGAVALGTTVMSQGVVYVVGGGTAGDINPASDMTSTWFLAILGYAYSPSVMILPTAGPIVAGISQV